MYEGHLESVLRCGRCNKPFDKVSPSVPGIPGVENFLEGNNDGDMPLDRALMIADTESTALEGRYGDEIVLDLDFTNFLNTHIDDDNMQYTASGSSSFVYHSTSSADGIVPEHHPGSSPNLSIPPGPTQFIRSLVQRPYMGAGAHRIAKLILHNLRSYPQMVLRHNTLPPFIHPSVVSSDFGNPDPESLTNCIALVHMIGSGIQATRKLFWKNVRMECERLCEECQKLNKWELLAAMQALSIYIIIRLDEGETDYNNFDVLLLNTITTFTTRGSANWERWCSGMDGLGGLVMLAASLIG
ncbi:hypothetical protein BDV27DRAFT_148096 [Aspergillus caelatus]|uniref:Uncharacterized protein n=1 Tax=Aspergillus caelatus TaxID=61420 RepID=A0A5N6ZU28_9EURO|nr:uncharacterized protein BDV27DRAFT_148096 [Aspergillus caelatus]KAE8361121.1 hypothetical protein BDV27DRAFT_148096 [Aspergillus caelatus]